LTLREIEGRNFEFGRCTTISLPAGPRKQHILSARTSGGAKRPRPIARRNPTVKSRRFCTCFSDPSPASARFDGLYGTAITPTRPPAEFPAGQWRAGQVEHLNSIPPLPLRRRTSSPHWPAMARRQRPLWRLLPNAQHHPTAIARADPRPAVSSITPVPIRNTGQSPILPASHRPAGIPSHDPGRRSISKWIGVGTMIKITSPASTSASSGHFLPQIGMDPIGTRRNLKIGAREKWIFSRYAASSECQRPVLHLPSRLAKTKDRNSTSPTAAHGRPGLSTPSARLISMAHAISLALWPGMPDCHGPGRTMGAHGTSSSTSASPSQWKSSAGLAPAVDIRRRAHLARAPLTHTSPPRSTSLLHCRGSACWQCGRQCGGAGWGSGTVSRALLSASQRVGAGSL
jgi:hypothetical protein